MDFLNGHKYLVLFLSQSKILCENGKEGICIWYMVHCPGMDIDAVIQTLRSRHPDKADAIFTLTYDRMRRYQGEWHMEEKPLFPDSFFVEKEKGKTFLEELPPQSEIQLLEPEEGQFLQNFCGSTHHSNLSQGRIREGRTEVFSGPLHGREHLIRKIDRHKRLAQLIVPGMEHVGKLCVGLEIVEKD